MFLLHFHCPLFTQEAYSVIEREREREITNWNYLKFVIYDCKLQFVRQMPNRHEYRVWLISMGPLLANSSDQVVGECFPVLFVLFSLSHFLYPSPILIQNVQLCFQLSEDQLMSGKEFKGEPQTVLAFAVVL